MTRTFLSISATFSSLFRSRASALPFIIFCLRFSFFSSSVRSSSGTNKSGYNSESLWTHTHTHTYTHISNTHNISPLCIMELYLRGLDSILSRDSAKLRLHLLRQLFVSVCATRLNIPSHRQQHIDHLRLHKICFIVKPTFAKL